jgi:hypothetical protein
MKPVIVENYLTDVDFKLLKEMILSADFPWYFNNESIQEKPSHFQFTHTFYKDDMKNNYYPLVEKIVAKLNPHCLLRIKANLNTQTDQIIETGEHVDTHDKRFTSAVFFINNNDGYCRVGDQKIYSKENTIIIFNSNTIHSGTTCTNNSIRVLINFVYID